MQLNIFHFILWFVKKRWFVKKKSVRRVSSLNAKSRCDRVVCIVRLSRGPARERRRRRFDFRREPFSLLLLPACGQPSVHRFPSITFSRVYFFIAPSPLAFLSERFHSRMNSSRPDDCPAIRGRNRPPRRDRPSIPLLLLLLLLNHTAISRFCRSWAADDSLWRRAIISARVAR